ncbi:hypothetical protein [Sporisorium scitamineum]|uniref:DDE-1 domain-containing protein n=1 Tax=Sporisorium scitamineum TaxID=49012 RepID=A0A0F7RVH5_9BASI|nr:hypothetical protein [Sporisorium scitamineum]
MDGHTSHVSNTIIDAFWSCHIIPLLLPAHLTHIMQPLDVSIFGPLMAAYHQTINDIVHDVIANIDRAKFATIYTQACDKAENSLLQMQEEQQRKAAQTVKWKDKAVDAMVLSKDKMIMHTYAECALVAKKLAMEANWRKYHVKKHWKEEEQVVVPPAVLADVGKQALDGSDGALLMSSRTAPMPSTLVIDSLDDSEPLSAIDEEN